MISSPFHKGRVRRILGGGKMKTRTSDEVWCDLEKLKGTTVSTLVNHVQSEIIDVNESGIKRRAETHNKEKTVDKSAFKRVWADLIINGNCKLSERWKFACACIALLPEVEYSLKPGTIWLSENRHDFGKLVEKII
jgi:hypothetical protein